MLINLVLSGDNAMVIAMATLRLRPGERKIAIMVGTGVAVVLRFVLIFLVGRALQFPFLQAFGGVLLAYLAMSLLLAPSVDQVDTVRGSKRLWGAVGLIAFADLAMSLDNIVALAGIADGNEVVLVLGLIVSISLIMFASAKLAAVLARYRFLQVLGAAALAWTAGGMMGRDPGLTDWLSGNPWLPLGLATGVVLALYGLLRLFRLNS